ncbi:MAG TPA: hypothetical protein VLF20_05885 [Patescibacteria group bacterium]|nr:hypothetical protein [Patescibacteria group bacterium]
MNIESIRIPKIPQRAQALRMLRERRGNAAALATHIGSPRKLFYAAGRADMLPVTIPSVEVMAIVDMVPLLLPNARINGYSKSIHDILQARNGRYIKLTDLVNDPALSDIAKGDLAAKVQASLVTMLEDPLEDNDFFTSIAERKSVMNGDSFADALASVYAYGGKLRTMKVGKFGDDYRIQFNVGWKKKTVIFNDTEINRNYSRPGTATARWAQHCFDGFGRGKTALAVKSDYNDVSVHVVDAVNPDIIFGSNRELEKIQERAALNRFASGVYQFVPVDSSKLPYPTRNWGYDPINEMVVGRKLRRSARR